MNKAQQLESGLRTLESGMDVLSFHAPVIGISGNFREGDCTLAQAYYMSVLEAGGTPVVIPSYDNDKAFFNIPFIHQLPVRMDCGLCFELIPG